MAVVAVPVNVPLTVRLLNSDVPDDAVILEVIVLGNLASSIVPAMILAAFVNSVAVVAVVAVPVNVPVTVKLSNVDVPDGAVTLEVITAGNLASLIVPVVMLAPSAKLFAVVAVPVKVPDTANVVTSISLKEEDPSTALMLEVIVSGNLASLIVPAVILAPLARLVAVVAVATKLPPTVTLLNVESPLDISIFEVIVAGNLASLIVPVVMLAASARLLAVAAIPVITSVTDSVLIPTVAKVEIPESTLILDVIKSGNLASLIVPLRILAPFARLVAVVAVPVKFFPTIVAGNLSLLIVPPRIFPASISVVADAAVPVTLPSIVPTKFPSKDVAVTTPEGTLIPDSFKVIPIPVMNTVPNVPTPTILIP